MTGSGMTPGQPDIVNKSETTENMEFIPWKDPRYPQYITVMTVTISAFSLGNVFGWSSPALPSILDSGQFHVNSTHLSLIGSLITIGAIPGGIGGAFCIEKLGRKNTLLISSIPLAIGWLSMAAATSVMTLLVGRFLTGVGVGSICSVAPVYLSEIAQPEIRGCLGSIYFVVLHVGILFAFVVGSFLEYNYLSGACAPFAIIFAVCIVYFPESPRYLLTIGDTKGATDALCWFRAASKKSPTEAVTQEITEMLDDINAKRMEKCSLLDLFSLPPLLIVLGLMFLNQFCGGNVFGFYTVMIFQETGSALDSHLSGIVVGVAQVVAAIYATFYVDSIGRRVILIVTFVLMCLSQVTCALFFHFKPEDVATGDPLNWIPLISLVVFNSAYSAGIAGLAFIVMSEILPSNVIGPASGLASLLNYILAFVTTQFVGDVNEAVGLEYTFWLFAFFNAFGTLFTYFCVPETNQKTLTKIQKDFDSRRSSRTSRSFSVISIV